MLGILASTGLAAVKIVGGVVGSSYALIADGIESMLDIVSSLVVWGSLKIAVARPTPEHPYGYGKVEPLAALVVAVVLLMAACALAVQCVREILAPHHAPAPFTLVILVVVVAIKELMFRRLLRTGAAIGSTSMKVDAWHHRSDAITSLAAFVGISVALLAGEGYETADDWAALLACSVIAYNGIRLFRSAWRAVLDVAPPPEVVNRIREVAAAVRDVADVEKCRVRKSGIGSFCEIHVHVDGDLPVREGHRIAHAVKDDLLAADLGLLDVVVHIEPDGAHGE